MAAPSRTTVPLGLETSATHNGLPPGGSGKESSWKRGSRGAREPLKGEAAPKAPDSLSQRCRQEEERPCSLQNSRWMSLDS